MRTSTFPATLLCVLLAAAPAVAQNKLVEVNDSVMVPLLNLSADAAEDLDVMGPGGVRIGEIDEVVGNDANTPSAFVVDFDDRSDYRDRDIAVPLDQFSFANGVLTLNTKPTDLNALPEYKD